MSLNLTIVLTHRKTLLTPLSFMALWIITEERTKESENYM